MRTKQIGIKEYAEKVNPLEFRANRKYPDNPITTQAVSYRILKGMTLPQVIKISKVGEVYVLTVNENF